MSYPPGPLPDFAIRDDDSAKRTLAAAFRHDRKRLCERYDAGEFADEARAMREDYSTLDEAAIRKAVVQRKLERRWPPF